VRAKVLDKLPAGLKKKFEDYLEKVEEFLASLGKKKKQPETPEPPPKGKGDTQIKPRAKKKLDKCFSPSKDMRKKWKEEARKLPPNKRQKFLNGKESEFYRQLKDQEAGLGKLTVREYKENRKKFESPGFKRTGTGQSKEREKMKKEISTSIENGLKNKGKTVDETKIAQQVSDMMNELAALHGPDLVAGGKNSIDNITRLGDSDINSSIGSQWKTRVDELDEIADKLEKELGPDAKMDVELPHCDSKF
jgi:hypothetical protein